MFNPTRPVIAIRGGDLFPINRTSAPSIAIEDTKCNSAAGRQGFGIQHALLRGLTAVCRIPNRESRELHIGMEFPGLLNHTRRGDAVGKSAGISACPWQLAFANGI